MIHLASFCNHEAKTVSDLGWPNGRFDEFTTVDEIERSYGPPFFKGDRYADGFLTNGRCSRNVP
jgi:hypothetical protein